MARKKQRPTIAYNPANVEGKRWVENASDGLRVVGTCHDIARGEGWRMDYDGWHLDPWGDGETVCGAVLQLPSRDGVAQFVPAMADPYNPDCYYADFGSVTDDKRDALRWADGMAERYAAEERDYQTEEVARQRCEDAREEIRTARAEHNALAAELRAALVATRHDISAPAICAAVRRDLARHRDAVRDAVKEIRRLTAEPWTVCER